MKRFEISNDTDRFFAEHALNGHKSCLPDWINSPKGYNWTLGCIQELEEEIAKYDARIA